MNIDWKKTQNEEIIYLRRDPNSVINHIIIRVTRNLWNSILLNNIRDEKDSKRDKIYLLTKKKKSNIMIVGRSDILSEIADSNNSSHSNIFRELYR